MDRCQHNKGITRPPPPLHDVRGIEGRPPPKLPGPVCKSCNAELTPEIADAADERVRLIARLDGMHEEAKKLEARLEAIEDLLAKAPAVAPAKAAASASVDDEAKRLAAPVDNDDAPMPTLEELAKMSPGERREVGSHMTAAQRQRLSELLA